MNKFNLYQRVKFKDGSDKDVALCVIGIIGGYGKDKEVMYDLAELANGSYNMLSGEKYFLVFEDQLENK